MCEDLGVHSGHPHKHWDQGPAVALGTPLGHASHYTSWGRGWRGLSSDACLSCMGVGRWYVFSGSRSLCVHTVHGGWV